MKTEAETPKSADKTHAQMHAHTHTLHTETSAIESTTRLRLNATILPKIKRRHSCTCDSAAHWHNPSYRLSCLLCRRTHTWLYSTRQPSHCYTQFETAGRGLIWRHGSLSELHESEHRGAVWDNGKRNTSTTSSGSSHSLHRYHAYIYKTDAHKETQKHKSCKRLPTEKESEDEDEKWRSKEMEGGGGRGRGGCTLVPSTGLWMTVVWGSWRKNEEKGWKKGRECFMMTTWEIWSSEWLVKFRVNDGGCL